MGVAKDSVRILEDLMRAIIQALTDRLGYTNSGRFIAIVGGVGNPVIDIRERRIKFDRYKITERIKSEDPTNECMKETKRYYFYSGEVIQRAKAIIKTWNLKAWRKT